MKHFYLLLSLLLFHSNTSPTLVVENPDDPIIDLMVVYTAAAAAERQKSGVNIKDWIEDAVISTNQALRNSLVNTRIDLVHTAQVAYKESSNSVDLRKLTDGTGSLQKVHRWRDTYHADAVILLTDNNQGGRAQPLMRLSGDYSCQRFAVVKSGYLSVFIHEYGHLLGAQHDDKSSGSLQPGIYPYAHGYTGDDYTGTTLVGGFMDVENYGSKFNLFSNPKLKYRNASLGDPKTGDNARTFNQTSSYVAKCKDSEVTWTGTANSDWKNPHNWSGKSVPRSIDDLLIPAGLSNYPTINGTANARNVEVSEGASINMTGGQFNVRGNFKVVGSFTATGGNLSLKNSLIKQLRLELSSSSALNDLTIGDGKHPIWVQLTTALKVKGNIKLEKSSMLESGDHSISVDGNWNDLGNGFDYRKSTVSIKGTSAAPPTVMNFPIPIAGDGMYSSELAGWSSIGEFGKKEAVWSFGGDDGQGYLDSYAYYTDDLKYDKKVDAWLFLPISALQAGVDYELDFEYKIRNKEQIRIVSLHYGEVQLPSRMTATKNSTTVPANGEWTKVSGTFKVPDAGFYTIGIRSYHPDELTTTTCFIRDIKLTPKVTIPESYGQSAGTGTTTTTTPPPSLPTCEAASAIEQYRTSMKPGDRLLEGQKLVSANGKYQLRATNDGDFVVEEILNLGECKFRQIWQAPLAGPLNNPPKVSVLSLNTDCNVCIGSKQNKGFCATNGLDENKVLLYSCVKAVLTDDGRLALVSNTGRETWSTSNPYEAGSATKKFQTTMHPGDKLYEGEKLVSANGKYQLRGTNDGRFVIEMVPENPAAIYKKVWIAPIGGRLNNPPNISVFSFNPDCNLCVGSSLNKGWCATNGIDAVTPIIIYKCQKAVLTDDGRLVLVNPQGQEIWSTD